VTVSVRPNTDAEEDFRDYIRWYENESAGLRRATDSGDDPGVA
jgi:hypothetical protein